MTRRDAAPLGAPCWIELYTSDPDKAQDFYAQLFGWDAESAGEEYGGYISFTKDDVRIAGGMKNDGAGGIPNLWSVYLATDSAKSVADATVEHGGQVIVPPMQVGELGSMTVLVDAGQASIGAWEPASMKGFEIIGEPGAPAWFELHTRDYDAAVAFYRDVFGWDIHAMSDTPEFRYSTFGEGDGALAGIMDASAFLPEGVPSNWQVYFAVEDADAAVTKIVELGGTVLDPPQDTPYGRLAQVADPTGAAFRIMAN